MSDIQDQNLEASADESQDKLEESLRWLEDLSNREGITTKPDSPSPSEIFDSPFHGLIEDNDLDLPDWLREGASDQNLTKVTDSGPESRLDWLAKMAQRESIEDLPTLEWQRMSGNIQNAILPPPPGQQSEEADSAGSIADPDSDPLQFVDPQDYYDPLSWFTPDKPTSRAGASSDSSDAHKDAQKGDFKLSDELPSARDLDAAMAWLDEFAASQDAPVEEIPSIVDRALASKLMMIDDVSHPSLFSGEVTPESDLSEIFPPTDSIEEATTVLLSRTPIDEPASGEFPVPADESILAETTADNLLEDMAGESIVVEHETLIESASIESELFIPEPVDWNLDSSPDEPEALEPGLDDLPAPEAELSAIEPIDKPSSEIEELEAQLHEEVAIEPELVAIPTDDLTLKGSGSVPDMVTTDWANEVEQADPEPIAVELVEHTSSETAPDEVGLSEVETLDPMPEAELLIESSSAESTLPDDREIEIEATLTGPATAIIAESELSELDSNEETENAAIDPQEEILIIEKTYEGDNERPLEEAMAYLDDLADELRANPEPMEISISVGAAGIPVIQSPLETALLVLDGLALPPGQTLGDIDHYLHTARLSPPHNLPAALDWLELNLVDNVTPEIQSEEVLDEMDLISRMPDDPDAILAWLEQMVGEEPEAEPRVAPPEQPATYPDDGFTAETLVENQTEIDLLSMPDDPDEAMAWLEGLSRDRVVVTERSKISPTPGVEKLTDVLSESSTEVETPTDLEKVHIPPIEEEVQLSASPVEIITGTPELVENDDQAVASAQIERVEAESPRKNTGIVVEQENDQPEATNAPGDTPPAEEVQERIAAAVTTEAKTRKPENSRTKSLRKHKKAVAMDEPAPSKASTDLAWIDLFKPLD